MTPTTTHKGFTLVEIMIVIVILSVFAGIVGVSVSGSEKRRQMQYYDKLVDDLKLVKLESLDQSKVYGMIFLPENATRDPSYRMMTLTDEAQAYIYRGGAPAQTANAQPSDTTHVAIASGDVSKLWQPAASFKKMELLPSMRIDIDRLAISGAAMTAAAPDVENINPLFADSSKLPDVLWYGNGEATPVKLTVYAGDKQIGEPIFIDQLGRVATSSLEAGL